jgi:hypothetical protein
LCALALLAILLVWVGRRGGDGPPAVTAVPVPDDWTMADLLRKLEPLGLRVVPASRGEPRGQLDLPGQQPAPADPRDVLENGAFLTARDDLRWEELNGLPKAAVPGEAALALWRGTVHVRIDWPPPATQPLDGGKRCALQAGRFHFFGDPEQLDRVEALLAE